jgi:hypothetical protein
MTFVSSKIGFSNVATTQPTLSASSHIFETLKPSTTFAAPGDSAQISDISSETPYTTAVSKIINSTADARVGTHRDSGLSAAPFPHSNSAANKPISIGAGFSTFLMIAHALL